MAQLNHTARALLSVAAALTLAACAPREAKTTPAAASPALTSAARPTAAASAEAPAPEARPAKAGSLVKLWGTVQSVDLKSGTLVIKNKHGRTRSLALAAGARLTRGGADEPLSPADIKPGDQVIVGAAGGVAHTLHVRVLESRSVAVTKAG